MGVRAWLKIKLLIKLWQEIREYFGWNVLFENVNKTIGETNEKKEKKLKCNVIQNFVHQVERKAALNSWDSLLLKSSCLPSQACNVTMYRRCCCFWCFWCFFFFFVVERTESRKKTKIWIFFLNVSVCLFTLTQKTHQSRLCIWRSWHST